MLTYFKKKKKYIGSIAQEVWFRDFVSKIVYYMYTTNKTHDIRPKKK
jgi:hypothetical protein